MFMNRFLAGALAVFLLFAAIPEADAKRLGGGQSLGRQSSNVTQRDAAPAPARPAQDQAAARPGAPNAAPAAPARPWGAMLGGLAAGLGLAWLASALGFGEAFAQFMLFALLALVVMVVVGLVMRARQRPQAGGGQGGYAFQGAGQAATAPSYKPENVGNDASARPWERNSMAFEAPRPGGGVVIGSALAGSQGWGVPAGFDVQGFLDAAKRNFVTLQDAWDRSDVAMLRSMMTDEMVAEIRSQLAEREAHSSGAPNRTEVVMLEAKLLGIEEISGAYMASVEFSGMIREEPSAGPSPFREVWNMTRPSDGSSGWLVAGLQALQ